MSLRALAAYAAFSAILAGCGAASRSTSSTAPPSAGAEQDATPGAERDATPTARASSKLKPAPDFTLRTLDGDTFTLSEHRGELPVVLNFWAPW